MRLLALDTSGKTASAALFEDNVPLGEHCLATGLPHSEIVLPLVDQLLTRLNMRPEDLDALAVSVGPGSFTGLRIGVSAVQGMAQALSIPIAPVPTLKALAYGGRAYGELICPMIDARRDRAYAALYRSTQEVFAPSPFELETLFEILHLYGESICFLGDGALAYREHIIPAFPHAPFPPPCDMLLRAGWVGAVALESALFQSPAQIEIQYLQPSQAERLRLEKETADGVF